MTRYYLPATLGMILLMFVAPWMELVVPIGSGGEAVPFLRTSGLQSAQGRVQFAGVGRIAPLVAPAPDAGHPQIAAAPAPLADLTQPAPLLWGFIACIGVALLATMLMSRGIGRSFMLISCAFVALAFLGLQASYGLPLQHVMIEPTGGRPIPFQPRWMPPYFVTWLAVIVACVQTINEARPRRGYNPLHD